MNTNVNAIANACMYGDCIFLPSIRAYHKNIHGTSNASHGTIQTCAVAHKLSKPKTKPSKMLFENLREKAEAAAAAAAAEKKYVHTHSGVRTQQYTKHSRAKMTNKSTNEH